MKLLTRESHYKIVGDSGCLMKNLTIAYINGVVEVFAGEHVDGEGCKLQNIKTEEQLINLIKAFKGE